MRALLVSLATMLVALSLVTAASASATPGRMLPPSTQLKAGQLKAGSPTRTSVPSTLKNTVTAQDTYLGCSGWYQNQGYWVQWCRYGVTLYWDRFEFFVWNGSTSVYIGAFWREHHYGEFSSWYQYWWCGVGATSCVGPYIF
jgi:hypothetical protein